MYVEGTLYPSISPPRNWDGYYAYSSRARGKLCLLLKGERKNMLTYRWKNPPLIEEYA
jgi:hypothetical protein